MLCGLYRGAPIGFAGHVQVDVGRLAASGSDVRFGRLAFRVQDIAKDHLRTFAAKHTCFAGSLPAGSTTDQGNLPIKPSHTILLRVSSLRLSDATHQSGWPRDHSSRSGVKPPDRGRHHRGNTRRTANNCASADPPATYVDGRRRGVGPTHPA